VSSDIFAFCGLFSLKKSIMAVPSTVLLNKNKKHFLGVPAPLGYVAGVGRG